MNSVEEEQQRKKGVAVSERSSGGIRFFSRLKESFAVRIQLRPRFEQISNVQDVFIYIFLF